MEMGTGNVNQLECRQDNLEYQSTIINVKLLAFLVWSDVWESGHQLPHVFSTRLQLTAVDYWATYSANFADEIKAILMDSNFAIKVLTPIAPKF